MYLKIAFVLLSLYFSPTQALEMLQVSLPTEAEELIKQTGVSYSLDSYSNLKIELTTSDLSQQESIIKSFAQLVEILKNKWVMHAVYIHIPLSIAQPTMALEALGFKLYHLDKKSREVIYLFDNGRNIPNMNNGYGAAGIFIARINPNRQKEILVLSEYDKKELTIPGGCTDDVELATETVVRECKEEVGLDLDPKKLRLLRIKLAKIPASGRNFFGFHFYTEVPYDTAVNINNGDKKGEVSTYSWVPIDDLKNPEFTFDGKKFAKIYRVILDGEASPIFNRVDPNVETLTVSAVE
jgi:8-oxo-dGTP pyrophosphatase MutT (NUDIX family)